MKLGKAWFVTFLLKNEKCSSSTMKSKQPKGLEGCDHFRIKPLITLSNLTPIYLEFMLMFCYLLENL